MTIPTDNQERAEAFRAASNRIIINWVRACRIKTPMSDVPDVLTLLSEAVSAEMERTYQMSKHPANAPE